MKCNEGFQPLISIERNNKHVRKEEFVLSVVEREAQDFAKEIAMKHLKSSALKDVLSTPGSVEKKQYMSCSSNSTADSHGLGSDSRSDKRKKNLVSKIQSELGELKSCDPNAFKHFIIEMVNGNNDIKSEVEESLIEDIGVRKCRTLHAELRGSVQCKTSFYKENPIPSIEERYDAIKRCVPELLSLIEKCLYPEKLEMKITEYGKKSSIFQASMYGADSTTPVRKTKKRKRSQELPEAPNKGFTALETLHSLENKRNDLEARINEIKQKATYICELIMNIRANGSLFTPTALEVGLISDLCGLTDQGQDILSNLGVAAGRSTIRKVIDYFCEQYKAKVITEIDEIA